MRTSNSSADYDEYSRSSENVPRFRNEQHKKEWEKRSAVIGSVLHSSSSTSSNQNGVNNSSKKPVTADDIATKVHAFLWILLATVVIYGTDIINVLQTSEKLNRIFLLSGTVLFGLSLILILYIAIWLPRYHGIAIDSPDFESSLIPVATFTGFLAFLCITIGLWPIYHIFTVFIIGTIFVGALMTAHFLPSI